MVEYEAIVSYEWQRRHLLRRYRQGLEKRADLCACDALLLTAADFHGTRSSRPCPVCGSEDLREVCWVYGDEIGRRAGSARSMEEITEWASQGLSFDVHRVEVCPHCRWNHLLATMVVSPVRRYA